MNSNTVINAAVAGLLMLGAVAWVVKGMTSDEDYCQARTVAVIKEVSGRTTTVIDDKGVEYKVANRSMRVGGTVCTRND